MGLSEAGRVVLLSGCITAALVLTPPSLVVAETDAPVLVSGRLVLPKGSKIAVAPLRSEHYLSGVSAFTPKPQWDSEARIAYGAQIEDAIERSGYTALPIDPALVDSGRGLQLSELGYAVIKAVDRYGSGRDATLMGKRAATDWSIGPGVSTTVPAEADYVLYSFLHSSEPTGGSVVTGVVGVLVGGGAAAASMADAHRQAGALLVDARSGDVVWSIYKFGTLASPRTADGADSLVSILFIPGLRTPGLFDVSSVVVQRGDRRNR